MIDSETLLSLHTNQRLLLEELIQRGVEVGLLVKELELVEARFGAHIELLLDRDSSKVPYNSSVIAANKYLVKRLLKRVGLNVPKGEQFYFDQKDDALLYAASLCFPVVVKPSSGSHGEGCITDIESTSELSEGIDKLIELYGRTRAFLVEEQKAGMEFRVFITRNGDYAVLHRDPAAVIGDGIRSIRELAEIESYERMNPRRNCLCPIVLDHVVERFLSKAGVLLSTVPAKKTKVYLRRNSNLAQGGSCEDYTGRAHPSFIDIAKRALNAIEGMPYAGIDILSTDITAEQTPQRYSILEINSNPGIHMHMRPARGEPQDIARYVADIIFPETKRSYCGA